jgi:hypothetical protein
MAILFEAAGARTRRSARVSRKISGICKLIVPNPFIPRNISAQHFRIRIMGSLCVGLETSPFCMSSGPFHH